MRHSWFASGLCVAIAWTWAGDAAAATLPEHDALDIVIIGDEVNPNGLSNEDLTQPQDIETALNNAGAGVNIGSLVFADSQCVDTGVEALEGDAADVLIYFAHVSARDCAGGDAQPRLTAATQALLRRGGGVVVFHHGLFSAGGKEEILALLGGTANGIFWDTTTGQDIINVAPDHFVTSNEVAYTGMRAFADPGFGIPMADYPVFNNTPDERYPGTQLITETGEDRTILFASDYSGAQILGYDLHRADWIGRVVWYQSGEYQPNALDAIDGPNFQILANAIYWVATTDEEPTDPTDGDSSGGSDGTSGPSTGSATSNNASGDDMGTSGPSGASASASGVDTDTDSEGAAGGGEDGCGCRSTSGSAGAPLLLVLACAASRRRGRRAGVLG